MQPDRLLYRWDFPGKTTRVGCHFLLQGVFLTQALDLDLLHWQVDYLPTGPPGKPRLPACLLSHFSRVRLYVTPEMAAHQASPSLGFSRQEHWSGLPFPSPMHKSEKWKWSRSVVSAYSDPMDCSLPGSSVREIFQERVLQWGAIKEVSQNRVHLYHDILGSSCRKWKQSMCTDKER